MPFANLLLCCWLIVLRLLPVRAHKVLPEQDLSRVGERIVGRVFAVVARPARPQQQRPRVLERDFHVTFAAAAAAGSTLIAAFQHAPTNRLFLEIFVFEFGIENGFEFQLLEGEKGKSTDGISGCRRSGRRCHCGIIVLENLVEVAFAIAAAFFTRHTVVATHYCR